MSRRLEKIRRASPSAKVVFSETRLILLKIAADLSARARAAIKYFPPRRTDEVPTAPSLRPGVEIASVPIFMFPSKQKVRTALSIWRRLIL